LINGGAQERVSENDSCSDLQEVVGFCRSRCVGWDAALLGGTPEQSRIAGWLGGRNEEELLSAFGQPCNAAVEARLDSSRQLLGLRDSKAAGQARRGSSARKLQQGQRVSSRLGDDPITNLVVERADGRRREQLACIIEGKVLWSQLRKPGELIELFPIAHREQNQHRFSMKPPSGEREGLGRGSIEPLGIVDQADEVGALGCLGKEAEEPEAHQKAVWSWAGAQSECRRHGRALWCWKSTQALEKRDAEQMESCKRKLHFRFHPKGRDHAASVRSVGDVVKERRFSDSGLATEHEHGAAPRVQPVEEVVKARPLGLATPQRLDDHLRDQA
jgi:hypothetical protein